MLEKERAIAIRDHVLAAVEYLMTAVHLTDAESSDPLETAVRKAIAIVVGELDLEILCKLYEVYPDIDDLKIASVL